MKPKPVARPDRKGRLPQPGPESHTPPQFFVPPYMVKGNQILLTEDLFRHAVAKRLRPGEIFRAVSGETVYEAKVESAYGGRLTAAIVGRRRTAPPKHEVHLYAALLKGPKFDLVVEKTTELGVSSVNPVVTRRTIPQLGAEKAAARQTRWEKIAKAASQQCGRPKIPEIRRVRTFSQVIEGPVDGLPLLAYEHENRSQNEVGSGQGPGALLGRLKGVKEASVFVGPEGGLDAWEVDAAFDRGFVAFSLGPYILKAETASLAAVAILMRLMDA